MSTVTCLTDDGHLFINKIRINLLRIKTETPLRG